eukprot:10321435-Heterocapsa_arctica.AAC.1
MLTCFVGFFLAVSLNDSALPSNPCGGRSSCCAICSRRVASMSQRLPKSSRLARTCVIDSQNVFHAFGQSTLEATRMEPRSGLPSMRMPTLHNHR